MQWRDVSVAEARELLAGDVSIQVLDIRTAGELADGALPGAQNIDFLREDFAERLNALPKDQTCLVYCRSGRRSAAAREIFQELGFARILHLANGVQEFVSGVLPTQG